MDDVQLTSRLRGFYERRNINVNDLIEQAEKQDRSMRHRAWGAAIATVAMLVMGLFYLHNNIYQAPQIYTTTTTQQDLILLEDGSVAALNVGSVLRVNYREEARELHLEKGQGLFRVRHDPSRPLRVYTGPASIEAIGTEFDVHAQGGKAIVAVVEGTVRLQSSSFATKSAEDPLSPGAALLTAGHSAAILADGRMEEGQPIDLAAITAWRRPAERLEFKDRPLAEIVDAFNRYNAEPKLRVEGAELRARRFFFIFDDAKAKSLLALLAPYQDVEVIPEGRDFIIRRRKP